MKIGIAGLPEVVNGFMPGRLYVAISDERRLMRQIVSDTLASSDATGLVTNEDTGNYLSGDGLQAWQSGKISALNLLLKNRPASFRRTKRLIAELDYFHFNQNKLLVIDPAEGLLNLFDALSTLDFIEYYQRWATLHQCSILLVFSELLNHPDCLRNLISLADHFAGIARLTRENSQPGWNILHWFSHQGMQGKICYGLAAGESGLIVEGGCSLQEVAVQPASALDDDMVYITRKAVSDGRDVPHMWQLFDSAETMLASAVDVVNATMVLDYTLDTDFETLAKQVFRLRFTHGNGIKLVVREQSAVIRHYHEQLLLRLGCNLVVPAGVSFSRFVSMLNAIHRHVFSRALDDDYESAIKNVAPCDDVGYLSLSQFVAAARSTLDGTQLTGVKSAFLQLNILPGVSAKDVLRLCHLQRPGDICTASEDQIYLFLFACRETDISLALDHVIELPVAELFVDQIRHTDAEDVALALMVLEQAFLCTPENFPDFTEALASVANNRQKPAGQKVAAKPDQHSVFNAQAPVAAISNPLQLKAG